jgi:hypothetical protein
MPAWVQPSWPQVQTISILLAIPSQWALQYFSFSGAVQLHAELAHFLGVLAIDPPQDRKGFRCARFRCREQGKGCSYKASEPRLK